MSNQEKSEACAMCCKSSMTDFMEDSLYALCNRKCIAIYPLQFNSDIGQIRDIWMVKDPPPSI